MQRLKLFGGLSIESESGPLTGRAVQRRRLALLALLAAARAREGGLSRDRLIALLWPDADAENGRRFLSDSVYRINQALGGDVILAAGDELRLDAQRLPSDVGQFGDALSRADHEAAVRMYVGPFLDGFFLPDAPEFERWTEGERDRLGREYGRALEALAELAEQQGSGMRAVEWWRKLAAHDPYNSRVALRLMQSLVAVGERAAAIQHARVHETLLAEELDVQPDAAVRALAEQLRSDAGVEPKQTIAPSVPEMMTPVARPTPDAAPDAVPAPVSSPDARAILSRVGEPLDPRFRGDDDGGGGAPAPSAVIPAKAGIQGLPHRSENYSSAGSQPRAAPPAPRGVRWAVLAAAALALAVLVVAAAIAIRGRWTAASRSVPDTRTIAVLPFANLSADRENEYFSDGITDELITTLGQVRGLRVVSRTSAFAFKNKGVDVREVGQRLGAVAVVEGSVRHAGGRLRITAQLVNVGDGYQLWSDTYDRDAGDAFAIQQEIASAIAQTLRVRLVGAGGNAGTSDGPDARAYDLYLKGRYALYLKGRYAWYTRTEEGVRSAARYFEQAVALDSTYARAHAGLADAYAVLGFYDYLPPTEAFPKAQVAARRAIALDPALAAPRATLGYVALYHDWDLDRAEEEYRRAIALEPNYSTAHQWYANHLTAAGRFAEAEREMRRAQEIDPLSLIANAALGWVLYHAGQYAAAADQCRQTLELNPNYGLAYLWMGWALQELDSLPAAVHAHRRAVAASDSSGLFIASLARTLALAGERSEAEALLRRIQARGDSGAYVPAYEIAKVHEALGRPDQAFAWLERALAERAHSLVFLRVDPQLARLQADPRYTRLLARVFPK